jgi:beta-lactamase regulating signal transducer with metallopeptidase domain
VRLTPINIVSACLIAWYFVEDMADGNPLLTITALISLLVVLLFVDIFFRVIVKQDNKLWLYELFFIVAVAILTLIIKIT